MMKIAIKFAVLTTTASLMYFLDLAPQTSGLPAGVQFMSEAHAVAGVRRRSARRGVAVGYAAGESSAAAASAASASTTQAAAATPAPAATSPAPVYGALPVGAVEPALPDGCTTMTADNVEYYHCGENYFRAVFQGNSLVYTTVSPPG